ncbi:hypothetical protein BRADI_1g29805v3 [Brachypodium distachyon]|uniref:Ubiquitin-like protease family profile domain-containing protein n=1 Tax=Brachypodium distachyon TaxID=15368 RepID=A0A0Q3JFA2_BRADI|nr:hypothetical protein BRADI_1g29805v3 [Brachypodium distachyon]
MARKAMTRAVKTQSCYDPHDRCLVLPERGRIPMTEESVYNALGAPRGELPVPYRVDKDIEARLAPELKVNTMLKEMTDSGDRFKRLVLMYIMSTIIAPTTSTRISNRCYPADNIHNAHRYNFCKFVIDQLHEALSKKKLNKGCRLYLMLLYVDSLDISELGLAVPTAPVGVSAWTNQLIDEVIRADTKEDGSFGNLQTRKKVETLVGQFASRMTSLLGNLVQGWTGLTPPESEEMSCRLHAVTGGVPTRFRSARGRFEMDSQPSGSEDDDDDDYVSDDDSVSSPKDDGSDSDKDDDDPHHAPQDGGNHDDAMDKDDGHGGDGSGNKATNNNECADQNANVEAVQNDESGTGGAAGNAAGELKLKEAEIMFPLIQTWGEGNDKTGHWYTISINTKQKMFEILDSLCGPDDDVLQSHSREMIKHMKHAWHEYYVSAYSYPPFSSCSDDCGFYMLEFMRKWDGRFVPALEPDDIVELRKVLTYKLIATQPFNENTNAKEFIEENTK